MPHVFVAGYPSSLGGANTELWHTLKLWRSNGLDVTCLALKDPPDREWCRRVNAIGCDTIVDRPENLGDIPFLHDIRGATVVAFCNYWFLQSLRRFDKLSCRIVWVPCMTWLFPDEQLWTKVCGMLDAYVYQSTYQAAQMMPLVENMCRMGKHPFMPERFHQIRGAFDVEEFPFRPKPIDEGEPFVIGRLSRSMGRPGNVPAIEKYPIDLWTQYAAIRRRIPHLKARVMGWCPGIEEKCGPPPEWAEVLSDCAETAQEFLASLHCLVPGIGCTAENWPRVGLEAMAAGVPIVVEQKGGWPEMAVERCCVPDRKSQRDCVGWIYDVRGHEFVAKKGRARVEELADPATIWDKWKQLFEGLQ